MNKTIHIFGVRAFRIDPQLVGMQKAEERPHVFEETVISQERASNGRGNSHSGMIEKFEGFFQHTRDEIAVEELQFGSHRVTATWWSTRLRTKVTADIASLA